MSNLDNMINTIKSEGNKKIDEIISKAKSEADKILKEKESFGKEESIKILEKAKEEAKSITERVVSNHELQVRNKSLESKQQIINTTLNRAISKLRDMNENDFKKFLENHVINSEMSGDEELIVCEKYKNIDITSLNEKMKLNGKNGNLKVSKTDRKISGGFIATKGGIEMNGTFDAIISYMRDDLETVIVRELF